MKETSKAGFFYFTFLFLPPHTIPSGATKRTKNRVTRSIWEGWGWKKQREREREGLTKIAKLLAVCNSGRWSSKNSILSLFLSLPFIPFGDPHQKKRNKDEEEGSNNEGWNSFVKLIRWDSQIRIIIRREMKGRRDITQYEYGWWRRERGVGRRMRCDYQGQTTSDRYLQIFHTSFISSSTFRYN